jgi:hypothetical protein
LTNAERDVYAIYCGQVRKPEYVLKSAEVARACLQSGVLKKAFVITWINELEKYGDLRAALEDAGMIIVEVDYREGSYDPHSTFHQLTHMRVGLDLCPDDAYVFKTRLDMAFNTSEKLVDHLQFLREADLEIKSSLSNFPLEEKIWLGKLGSLDVPFWLNDRFIFGKKVDVEKILGFSMEFEFTMHFGTTINEVRWFSTPFIKRFPLVRNILRVNWMKTVDMIRGGTLTRSEVLEFVSKFDFYWTAQAFSYRLIEDGFLLGAHNFSTADYSGLVTPLRVDGDELPEASHTAAERYADLMSDPRFHSALEKVSSDEFHSQYDYFDDPEFEEFAKGMRHIAEFPFPVIKISQPRNAFSEAQGTALKSYYDNPSLYGPTIVHGNPGCISSFFSSAFISQVKLFISAPKRAKPGAQIIVEVLIENLNDKSIPLNPGGRELLLSSRWVDEQGQILERPWPRHALHREVRQYYRHWFHETVPDLPGHYKLVVDLLIENVMWFKIESEFNFVVSEL